MEDGEAAAFKNFISVRRHAQLSATTDDDENAGTFRVQRWWVQGGDFGHWKEVCKGSSQYLLGNYFLIKSNLKKK